MTGQSYIPQNFLTNSWRVVQLSQKDASADIPINYVPQLAVSLTPSCFGHKQYHEGQAAKCISNLLAVGYRRFFVDLFWSSKNQQWQLCPLSDPSEKPASSSTDRHLSDRERGDFEDITRPSHSVYGPNPTSEDPASPNAPLYSCFTSISAEILPDVLRSYFQMTIDNPDAAHITVILNLYEARVPEQQSSNKASQLSNPHQPSLFQRLSDTIVHPLGSYVYTPDQLFHERLNLKESWLSISNNRSPMGSYFAIMNSIDGVMSTPNGWPSSYYLEKVLNARVIFGLGTVSSSIQDLTFQENSTYIFPTGVLTSHVQSKELPSGCFYDPSVTDFNELNSSWAFLSETFTFDDKNPTTKAIDVRKSPAEHLLSCGIAPLVNDTLSGKTADDEVNPYQNISLSSIWSWAPGEPYNGPTTGSSKERRQSRCAVMDTTASGHWRAVDCSKLHRAACRVDGQPYSWVLSANELSFSDSADGCPSNTSFDLPRTGLENLYLNHQAASLINTTRSSIWINFNSLDVKDCWTVSGPNATCPYPSISNDQEREHIVVPTVAAVVILVLAALTLFVKCNANRRRSRRRRINEGWEYEGVPA